MNYDKAYIEPVLVVCSGWVMVVAAAGLDDFGLRRGLWRAIRVEPASNGLKFRLKLRNEMHYRRDYLTQEN